MAVGLVVLLTVPCLAQNRDRNPRPKIAQARAQAFTDSVLAEHRADWKLERRNSLPGDKERDLTVGLSDSTIEVDAWGGEVAMRLKLNRRGNPFRNPQKSVGIRQDRPDVRLTTSGMEHRMYSVYDSTRNKESMEWEFTLPRKAGNTNVFTFDIETAGLDFFYQPPYLEQLALQRIEEPHIPDSIFDGLGRWVPTIKVPDSVEGSYAVYHKIRRDNWTMPNGTVERYFMGKAFHIYRPKAISASGDTVWCDLNVDTVASTLTITVPKSFWDTTSFPLIVDPVWGYDTIGASSGLGRSTGDSYAGKIYPLGVTASGWTIDTMASWTDDNYNTGCYWVARLYSWSGGTAVTGLTTRDSVAFSANDYPGEHVAVPVLYSPSINDTLITGYTCYGSYDLYYDTRTNGVNWNQTNLPNTWAIAGTSSRIQSHYVAYSTGAAPSTSSLPVGLVKLGGVKLAPRE